MEKNIENNEKIIYDELISLTENITNYFAGQLQDYFGLINYMEQLSLEFKTFSSKIKLPKGYLENKSKDNLAINCFYDFHCFLCGDFLNRWVYAISFQYIIYFWYMFFL